jgi:hypothetical protein
MTEGTYRLVWQLYKDGSNGEVLSGETAASNTFTVTDTASIVATPTASR